MSANDEIFEFKNGGIYLLDNGKTPPFKVRVVGSPNTFSGLIRVMGMKSKREWYERKHLLKKNKRERKNK